MNHSKGRWYYTALTLFLLVLTGGCRQEPMVDEEPLPEQQPAVQATLSSSSGETQTATPIPFVSFMGVEFAYDEQFLGPLGQTAHLHAAAPGELPAQPERIEIGLNATNDGRAPTLYVFPVAQYEALSDEAAEEIRALRDLLATRPASVQGALPLLPMHEAIESYHSDPTYVDFRNGAGVSYLVKADHDHSLSTEEAFFYTFQGLTDDGKFYVATFIPLIGASTSGNGDEESLAENAASADHQAKSALAANWIGADNGEGLSLVNDIMSSLLVSPDEGFPRIRLPDYVTQHGLLLGYDRQISGEAAFDRVPAIVEQRDGSSEFLPELPDILLVSFAAMGDTPGVAELEIQAVRNIEGEFFTGIPAWQQQEVVTLESGDETAMEPQLSGSTFAQMQALDFQNGKGLRWIASAASAPDGPDTYTFSGVTDDGRYLIRFHHPIPLALSEPDAITYLDSVVSSLVIAADASTGSSVPLSPADCTDDAEFVEDVSIPDHTVIDRGETFVKIWRVRNSGTCSWTPAYKLSYAQGNPIDWQGIAITDIVAPDGEIELGVSILSPEVPGIYQTWWQLADEQDQRFGDLLTLVFVAPEPATDIPGYGVVEGAISYPANGNPAIDIYFQRTDGSERYAMRTERGWTDYSNAIPVGSYYVFGRVAGDSSNSGGGYTEAVICGLYASCDNHSLVEVVVEEGVATRNVNIYDWYAPAGSFPLPEPAVVPDDNTEGS